MRQQHAAVDNARAEENLQSGPAAQRTDETLIFFHNLVPSSDTT